MFFCILASFYDVFNLPCQIESLVTPLMGLLLSRWEQQNDFSLSKPMMLLLRWVEAYWTSDLLSSVTFWTEERDP